MGKNSFVESLDSKGREDRRCLNKRLFIIFGVFDLLQSIASGIDASVSIPKSIHNSVANCSYEHKI